jgi:AraC-like DNA-binding protein
VSSGTRVVAATSPVHPTASTREPHHTRIHGASRRGNRAWGIVESEARKLFGPAFALVGEGEYVVRAREQCLRLERGDLLTLGVDGECALEPCGPRARAHALELGAEFAERVSSLAGFALASSDHRLWIDRRGSDAARRAARLLRQLGATAPLTPREALEMTALRVELLALALQDRPFAVAPGAVRRPERPLRDAVEELFAGPLEDVALSTLAARVGLSERQASRVFRAQYGKTFRDHLCECRIERAKQRLTDTAHSVIRVAGETGWSSLAHFNAAFRRRVGLTPTQFRAWARYAASSRARNDSIAAAHSGSSSVGA